MGHHHRYHPIKRLRPRSTIPQAAGAAPLLAFAVVGTTVSINEHTEHFLQATAWPVLLVAATAIIIGTRLARVVSGALLVVWWGILSFAVASIAIGGGGTVSWFGALTFIAIPVLVAFTWGQAWGPHDIEEGPRR